MKNVWPELSTQSVFSKRHGAGTRHSSEPQAAVPGMAAMAALAAMATMAAMAAAMAAMVAAMPAIAASQRLPAMAGSTRQEAVRAASHGDGSAVSDTAGSALFFSRSEKTLSLCRSAMRARLATEYVCSASRMARRQRRASAASASAAAIAHASSRPYRRSPERIQ